MLSYTDRPEKATKSKKRKNLIANIVIVTSVSVMVGLGVSLLSEGLIDAAASEKYTEVAEKVVREDHLDYGGQRIDFAGIQETTGVKAEAWIQIEGTVVDYPLVQSSDNDYYLDHNAYGEESRAGAIFINYINYPDFSDPKTVIFGHNQSDGSMFTCINDYGSKAFGEEHDKLTITTADGRERHYKLLCYRYTYPTDEAVYLVSHTEDKEASARALLDGADVVYSDYGGGSLVCLSTCMTDSTRSVAVFECLGDVLPETPVFGDVSVVEVSEAPGTPGAVGTDNASDTDNNSGNRLPPAMQEMDGVVDLL